MLVTRPMGGFRVPLGQQHRARRFRKNRVQRRRVNHPRKIRPPVNVQTGVFPPAKMNVQPSVLPRVQPNVLPPAKVNVQANLLPPPSLPLELNKQLTSEDFYRGRDVHAYTQYMRAVVPTHHENLVKKIGPRLTPEEVLWLEADMRNKYGNKEAFPNIFHKMQTGYLADHDVPNINFALFLWALWEILKKTKEESLFNQFGETLDHIGSTCVQGITHRVFCDYIAIAESISS